jgi:hypothetical protein
VQTAIVSLVALGALLIVVRRVLGAIRPPKGTVACPSCASGSDACGTSAVHAASAASGVAETSDVQPMVLIRSKTH